MKFNEMLKPLREGKKIRLPQWVDYWQKNDNGEIIIHRYNYGDINIKDCFDIFWVLENICSEEWEVVEDDVDKRSKEVSSDDLYHFVLDKYVENGGIVNAYNASNINTIVRQLVENYNINYK